MLLKTHLRFSFSLGCQFCTHKHKAPNVQCSTSIYLHLESEAISDTFFHFFIAIFILTLMFFFHLSILEPYSNVCVRNEKEKRTKRRRRNLRVREKVVAVSNSLLALVYEFTHFELKTTQKMK